MLKTTNDEYWTFDELVKLWRILILWGEQACSTKKQKFTSLNLASISSWTFIHLVVKFFYANGILTAKFTKNETLVRACSIVQLWLCIHCITSLLLQSMAWLSFFTTFSFPYNMNYCCCCCILSVYETGRVENATIIIILPWYIKPT